MNALQRGSLALLTALLIVPASAARAGEGFGALCALPNDVPFEVESAFLELGEIVVDSKKECKDVCVAFAKACRDTVKNSARCITGLAKPALRAASKVCDDSACKKGVKEDAKLLHNELRDDTKNAFDLCKQSADDCRASCKDFVEEDPV